MHFGKKHFDKIVSCRERYRKRKREREITWTDKVSSLHKIVCVFLIFSDLLNFVTVNLSHKSSWRNLMKSRNWHLNSICIGIRYSNDHWHCFVLLLLKDPNATSELRPVVIVAVNLCGQIGHVEIFFYSKYTITICTTLSRKIRCFTFTNRLVDS